MRHAKQDCYGVQTIGDAEVRRQYLAGDPVPDGIKLENESDGVVRDTAGGTLNAPVQEPEEKAASSRRKAAG